MSWDVDNTMPTAPRRLSAPLTTVAGSVQHPVSFDGWDMWLTPTSDRPTATRRQCCPAPRRPAPARCAVVLANNTQVTANDRFTRLAGAYGPLLVGNKVTGALACSGNSAPVKDFGAKNVVTGARTGDCAKL